MVQFKTKFFRPEHGPVVALVQWDSGRLNVLSRAALAELRLVMRAINEYGQDFPLTAVILTGNDKGLGAGADVKELFAASPYDLEKFISEAHAIFTAIETSPVPWIAAVDGFCLGGCLELALACSVIIGSQSSRFGLPEVTLGIIPGAGGTQRLPRRVGMNTALNFILSGEMVKGTGALTNHLIDRLAMGEPVADAVKQFITDELPTFVSPKTARVAVENPKGLREETAREISKILLPHHRLAAMVAMDTMLASAPKTLAEALKFEQKNFLLIATTPTARAAMQAFLDKSQAKAAPVEAPTATT
ncbi:enoyl-CoA hydratase/isomerase family protein [Candidatus Falkowbacteria bacterium]|nr:enoyl-CoA hydratase/isomerase family protein [Candidatus Falkowbacteria bacterium]